MKFLRSILIIAQVAFFGLLILSFSAIDTGTTMKAHLAYSDHPAINNLVEYRASDKRSRKAISLFRGAVILLLVGNWFGIQKINSNIKLKNQIAIQ